MDELSNLQAAFEGGLLTRRQFIRAACALGLSSAVAVGLAGGGVSDAETRSAAPAGGLRPDKSLPLVVAMNGDIGPIDPNEFKSNSGYMVVANIYETLQIPRTRIGGNGAIEATAGIAPLVSESYTSTKDGTVYTFRIRPGVRFSNGDGVTASTIVSSYQRSLKYPGVSQFMMNLLRVNDEAQFRVVGPMTFQVKLGGPNPLAKRIWPLSVLNVLDPKVTAANTNSANPQANAFYAAHSMGTGPYMQGSEWIAGNQYLLEPNPHYWNPRALKNSGILLQYIANPDDQLLALERGDIDVALSLPVKSLKQLESNRAVRVWKFQAPTVNFLSMNAKVPPFHDYRVRQAIAWAMPYETLLNSVWHGYARPINSIIPSGMPTSKNTWTYHTNLNKSRALLEAAGLKKGFHTTLGVSVSSAEDQEAAVWIQSSLAKVGVSVSIDPLSDAVFRQKEGTTALPMVLDDWYSWVNDPYYQFYFMLDTINAPGTNISNYSNPQVDRLIKEGMYNPNQTERVAYSHKIQEIYNHDVPRVLLYQQDYVVATRANVHGVDFYPDELQRLWQLWKS